MGGVASALLSYLGSALIAVGNCGRPFSVAVHSDTTDSEGVVAIAFYILSLLAHLDCAAARGIRGGLTNGS